MLNVDPETAKQVWGVVRGVALFWLGGVAVNLLTPQRTWDRLRAAMGLSFRKYRIYRLKREIEEIDAAKAYPPKAIIDAIWDATNALLSVLTLSLLGTFLVQFRLNPEALKVFSPVSESVRIWAPLFGGMFSFSLFRLLTATIKSTDIDGYRAFLVHRLGKLEGHP